MFIIHPESSEENHSLADPGRLRLTGRADVGFSFSSDFPIAPNSPFPCRTFPQINIKKA